MLFLFFISFASAYNWQEEYVIDSSRAYFVDQDGDFHSAKIVNAIDDPAGVMKTSSAGYINPNGNFNTLEESAGYVQENSGGNFDCNGLIPGGISHIRKYETFTNPSIYSDEAGEIRIVFSKVIATRDSSCPRTFGDGNDEIRIRKDTSENIFHVKVPNGGGLVTRQTNIYPDERCINRFDISSQTQRVVVDDEQRTFVAYSKEGSSSLPDNCDNVLDDYETSPNDANYQKLIEENFKRKFNDGFSVQICNVRMLELWSDDPNYCTTALSGLEYKFPTLIMNKENKGLPSDNYDSFLIYVKQNKGFFGTILSYDISYLTYRGTEGSTGYDYPKKIGGVINMANLPDDVVIESISGAVDPKTKKPAVIYYDPVLNKVSVIHYYNGVWKTTVVADRPFDAGVHSMPGMRSPNLEFDSRGGIHVSYVVNSGNLRYGYLHPGATAFSLQTVNGPEITTDIDTNHSTFISKDDNNYPHIYLNGKHYSIVELEICNNGIDDNGNTYTDCEDFGCYEHPSCLQNPVCGDGVLNTGEQCDDGISTDTYYTVNPSDNDGYCVIDNSRSYTCKSNICGDGYLDTSVEQCDDNNIISGDGCSAACTLELPTNCGNGIVEAGETCDGTNFNGLTCSDFDSFTGGSLSCNNCQIDTSSCTGGVSGICGDGVVNAGETCDGTNFNGLTCSDFDNFNDVNSLSCDSVSCLIDTSSCIGEISSCGDGAVDIEDGEECDDGDLIDGNGCSSICLLEDGASCNNNGVKETGEHCDGSDGINPPSCQDLGYDGGSIGCTSLCGYSIDECSICGNDICETGETTSCPDDCTTIITEISCGKYTTESACDSAVLTDEINNTIEAMNPQFPTGFCGDPSLTFEGDEEGESYSSEACGIYFSCDCKWFADDTSPNGGECDGITRIKENNPDNCSDNGLGDYFCRTTGSGTLESCIAGNEYTLSWTAQAYDSDGNILTTPVSWCLPGSKNFPCPSSSKIPFFTAVNIIIALIIIGVVYYIILSKKSKEKKKK